MSQIYMPNLSAQAKKFWILINNGFNAMGVRILWLDTYLGQARVNELGLVARRKRKQENN